MPQTIYSGTGFTLDVGTETTFNSGTVLVDFASLGIMTKFTSYELDNGWTAAYQLNQRYPSAFYTNGLKVGIALDFYMCEDSVGWLQFVLGPPTGGTYTVGTAIATGVVNLGTPQGNKFIVGGIAFNTAKFAVTQGSPVEVTLTGTGASFGTVVPGTVLAGTIPSQLLTWKDVAMTVGPTTQLIQSLNFNIDTGASLYYALGSATYQAYLPLKSEITGDITAFHNDAAFDVLMNLPVLGSTVVPSNAGGTITVTMGSHTVTFTGVYLTKGTLGLEPVKEATDKFDFSAQQITFV
jgi:hypothetical protein